MEELLKFITCGSVDDGKSTLIGHMLYDAKLLFTDQEKSLKLDSKVGARDGKIDYSLLLDGLMAEREQGITIDVAYRYFSTQKRSFIVADTPGHEEYTRNMAVGASFAQLAIILMDASKGVLVQTRRHARICNMMGIRHFVFAVNKMDLVAYDEDRFLELKKMVKEFMAEYEYDTLKIIPVSATEGDFVTTGSDHMSWYRGEPLLTYLENVDVGIKSEQETFSLPVQRVSRPNHTFRGFQGQIESGEVHVGDEVSALPSGETALVERILAGDTQVEAAEKGNAVTVCLDREIDVSRGSVLCTPGSLKTSALFVSKLLWMDDQTLVKGKNYWLKLGTKMIPATVLQIRHQIDVNSGQKLHAQSIRKNEIAVCEIATSEPIVFERFKKNQALGCFILIDRISHMTSACGIIQESLERGDNLFFQKLDITKDYRCRQKDQRSLTIWFTGLSGSGKSTLANELEKRLVMSGKHTMLLDGDNVRMGLNKDLDFSQADIIENMRRISEVAKLMNDAGLIVLTSFISPFTADRRRARELMGDDFVEIYVKTSIEECERRDKKGLYQKARSGRISNFVGISIPYEAPRHADIEIDTTGRSVTECIDDIIKALQEKNKL